MMGNIKTLSLDLETYSSYDLKKCGVHIAVPNGR